MHRGACNSTDEFCAPLTTSRRRSEPQAIHVEELDADSDRDGQRGHRDAESLDEDRGLLGSLVETFVFQELQRLASGSSHVHKFHHYRDRDGHEVDIVVERDGRKLVGVEVKAGSTVRASDFRGIRRLRDSAGSRFTRGVIFYDGEEVLSFGKDLLAVPLSKLWTTS